MYVALLKHLQRRIWVRSFVGLEGGTKRKRETVLG